MSRSNLLMGVVAAVLIQAAVVRAQQLQKISEPASISLGSALEGARYIAAKSGGSIVANAYAIEGDVKIAGDETMSQAYLRTAYDSLRRDYPMTGDDVGFSFKEVASSDAVASSLPRTFAENPNAGRIYLIARLMLAIENGHKVYCGSGSDGNPYASIVMVIDEKNRQFLYLMESSRR